MSGYVTDTHALLLYLFTPEKLESTALSIFDGIGSDDPLVVPAVVVAEMAMVVERRRIGATVNELIEVIKSLRREGVCVFPPLTADDILASSSIVGIPDIFDRLIVYEAQKRDAVLITKDEAIISSALVSTTW